MKRNLFMTAAAMATALAIAAPAGAAGGDNTAVNVNTHDGQSRYRIAFKIQRVNQDVVDNGNAAVAVASCEGCQTVSVAMQALLLFSDPSTFAPENLALALNVECFECNTLATAYQNVLQTGGPAHFSAEGNRRIAGIRQELQALRGSDLSIYEIQERVDALHNELSDVLATEVVSAGPPTEASPEPTAASIAPEPAEPTASALPETGAETGTSPTEPVTADSSGEGAPETEGSAEPEPSDPSAEPVPMEPAEDATYTVP
jgi:putative peptide zinc metalloprotease protein